VVQVKSAPERSMQVFEVREPFGLDSLALATRPDPVPGPNEVVIRMQALSLNFRDRLVIDGFDRWRPTAARIPGSDGVGLVAAKGPGVTRVKEGDRVAPIFYPRWIEGEPTPTKMAGALGGAVADGLYAECALAHESAVVRLPPHLSNEEAATLPCAALTAW